MIKPKYTLFVLMVGIGPDDRLVPLGTTQSPELYYNQNSNRN